MNFMIRKHSKCLIICLFVVFLQSNLSAQFHGLFFNSSNQQPNNTTGINLQENGFFEFKDCFELKFDLKIRNEPYHDFGYIVRIVGENGRNVDLVYDHFTENKNDIKVIYNSKISEISLNINQYDLLNNWKTISFKINLLVDQLVLQIQDTVIVEKNLGLDREKRYKFLFGTNHYELFETTNTPPVNIKDITISSGEKLLYNLPLTEETGNYATDLIEKKRARIYNPVWLNNKHKKWEHVSRLSLEGRTDVILNKEQDSLILLSQTGLSYYSLISSTSVDFEFSQETNLNSLGYELIPGKNPDNFFIINSASKEVLSFDKRSGKLTIKHAQEFSNISEWSNKSIYDTISESLISFGGYNGKEYLNTINNFKLNENNWETTNANGDVIQPRYGTSLGINNSRDTIYFLGGYGSATGNAMVNPHLFSDLYAYSIRDNSFKKIFEYGTDFGSKSFSSTMFIDSYNDSFYSLSYSPFETYQELHLLKGSLSEPQWKVKFEGIPFDFKKDHSTAKLFYSNKLQRLYAITSCYYDSINSSDVNVYSIMYPPVLENELDNGKSKSSIIWIWIIIIVGFDVILILITVRKRIKSKKAQVDKVIITQPEPGFFSTDLLKNTWKAQSSEEGIPLPDYRIYLFGGFQFYIGPDDEISKKFSPILKELFLLILLHSSENLKGVSTKNLIEQLWGDMSLKNAKNNLSVNINKLRAIVGEELSALMENISGHWKFNLEGKENLVFCDYWETWRILRTDNIRSKVPISNIIDITQRGGLLLNSSYEWLDAFKSKISNEIIDLLTDYAIKEGLDKDPDFAIKIADAIFLFDMINEQAMEIKCNALAKLGKHSMSRDTYNKFIKEYKLLYDETYNRTLKDIIG